MSATEVDEEEYAHEKTAISQAERRMQTALPDAEPIWIRCADRSRFRKRAMQGDNLIVTVTKTDRKIPYEVRPPTSLLLRQDRGDWTRLYYDPDLAAPLKSIDWATFRSLLKQAGFIKRVTHDLECELTVREFLELHRLWPKKRR